MPHEQSFLSSVLSVWEDQLTVMRLFFSLVHPLLRASGKDKAMKRIPKTPVEFDYDLWTTEDGKCMVRVKATGETTEVDREVMKMLRNEEKRLRRSYDTGLASDSEDGDETQPSTALSLDAVPEDEVNAPTWLADPHDFTNEVVTKMQEAEFMEQLTAREREVFLFCIQYGGSQQEYGLQDPDELCLHRGNGRPQAKIRRRRFSENYFSKERGMDHRRRDARSHCQQGRV